MSLELRTVQQERDNVIEDASQISMQLATTKVNLQASEQRNRALQSDLQSSRQKNAALNKSNHQLGAQVEQLRGELASAEQQVGCPGVRVVVCTILMVGLW